MKKLKRVLNRIFIEGMSGMALGLFATLIVGTIMSQIGMLIGGTLGNYINLISSVAKSLTCAGIGVGVAWKFKQSSLVTVSAAVAGMVGGFASKILAGTLLSETGAIVYQGPGEPLGAFIAAYVAIEVGRLVAGKTKVDILVTPITTIASGAVVGILIGPPISEMMTALGTFINWSAERQPVIMGILIAVVMGMVLTLPISSAALAIVLGLSGVAAGAAVVGCSAQMVGFAVASFRENKMGGLIAQGIGTSMLQVPNIMRKPIIWLPPIIVSAILGPISSKILGMTCNAAGAGMGTSGLVGQITAYQTMTAGGMNGGVVLMQILVMHILAPAVITLFISEFMRKKQWIKEGDMKLDL